MFAHYFGVPLLPNYTEILEKWRNPLENIQKNQVEKVRQNYRFVSLVVVKPVLIVLAQREGTILQRWLGHFLCSFRGKTDRRAKLSQRWAGVGPQTLLTVQVLLR